jgi:hypothetical protein
MIGLCANNVSYAVSMDILDGSRHSQCLGLNRQRSGSSLLAYQTAARVRS